MCGAIILAAPAGGTETCTGKLRSAGNCVPPKSNPISDSTANPPFSLLLFVMNGGWLRESASEDCFSLLHS